MYNLTLPMYVMVGKHKRYPLNLNHYRNAHYCGNNKGKITFDKLVKAQVMELPAFQKVFLIYKIFPARMVDVGNIAAIVDKFFCDSLVKHGRLPDDNSRVVIGILSFFGGVDPKNPRVEATICPISEVELDLMKITIDQSEIENAIKDYIAKRVSVMPTQKIAIGLSATRGATGFMAEIDISDADEPAVVEAPAPVTATKTPETVTPTKRAYTRKAAVEAPVKIPAEDPVEEPVQEPEEEEKEEVEAEEVTSSALEDLDEAVEATEPKSRVLFGKRST